MPLILISGIPASGKSRRAQQLRDYFEERGKKVIIVSENDTISKSGFNKNELFGDSQKEKQIRSDLKSELFRNLSKENICIFDASNYIKGYRYEIYCASKAARGTQCTLYCAIQKDRAWELNINRKTDSETFETYSKEIFDALCMRYEEPQANCRWDSPLFISFPDDKLEFQEIWDALFKSKPLPPNQSTQNPPLNATNYLFELDKITQGIINEIISARKVGICGAIAVKNSNTNVDIPDCSPIQLNRFRRQFLNYSKLHTTDGDLNKIPQLFVQFLNANVQK